MKETVKASLGATSAQKETGPGMPDRFFSQIRRRP
jgi:hypothetical protein